jgi:glycosyltransferase 2 family protein
VDLPCDCKLDAYPVLPLLGAIGFLVLRSLGLLLMFLALTPVAFHQIPMLLSAFNLAWLSPIVLPAVPGGIGVFEATAIALLNQPFSTGVVLSVVAIYRLISILAEATGAGLASLHERRIESQKI